MIPRYEDPRIRSLFNRTSQYGRWRDVERAVYPDLPWWQPNIERIDELERHTHHDVVAFILDAYEQTGFEDLHYGLTSSDVVDCGLALALRTATHEVRQDLLILADDIKLLCQDKPQPVPGYTHLREAFPITWSRRGDAWRASLWEVTGRLSQAGMFARVGKLSGPSGDNRVISVEAEHEALARLGLYPVAYFPPLQAVPRLLYTRVIEALEGVARVLAKIAGDLRLLIFAADILYLTPSTEIGSSSLPFKVNPIPFETAIGLCNLVYGYSQAARSTQEWWLERDIVHSSVERVAYPDAFHAICSAIANIRRGIDMCVPTQYDLPIPDMRTERGRWREILESINKGATE